MRKHYYFPKAKRNPYARRLKQQATIWLDQDTIGYFKNLSEETGLPYRTLINLYLRECAFTKKKLSVAWRPAAGSLHAGRGTLTGWRILSIEEGPLCSHGENCSRRS